MQKITNKKSRIMIKGMLLGVLLFLLSPVITFADDEMDNVVGFNYKIEYPKSQIGGENGFFDLELSPGVEETVTLNISNGGKKNVTVNLSINGTKTNSNGIIEYGPTNIENDKSLKFPFEKIVSGPEKVEVKAGEVKSVPIKIKMPETAFEGSILGGVQMKKADQEEETQSEGATVRNTYSYVVAMRLRNNQTKVKPEIKFNKAQGSQRNYRNSVVINLSNIKGTLVKNTLDIESQITKKGSEEVLYERKQTGMSIAPNSQMDFYVSMAGEQMVPGDYRAKVLASIGDQKWEETLDFTITKEEADKYNKRDVGLVQDRGLDWKIVAVIVAGALVVIGLLFAVLKIMKNKRSGKKGKKKSSRKSQSNRKN